MISLRLGFLFSALHLTLAVNVYLNPESSSPRGSLSPEDASSALSQHLGLELFEFLQESSSSLYGNGPADFVAIGQKNALIVTMEEQDAKAILPSSLLPLFKLSGPTYSRVQSLSSVLRTYLHRARHTYSTIYESNLSIQNPSKFSELQEVLDGASGSAFATLDLTPLVDLRQGFDSDSVEYQRAVESTRVFLRNALEIGHELQLAILTYSSGPSHTKRQTPSQVPFPSHAPPQQPIGSVSTCFASENACSNATDSCSGRGQCVEASKSGRTCFVCACSASKTGKGNQVKTEHWVGESCERKDVSGQFVLFVGVGLVMLILAYGSVSLLYGVGEQTLPPTLTGTAVHAKKD
ncbi:hypothetical protein D9757_010170 [Collybiopsis confluens]|uniref:Vacuolar sorting protein Vps3844 C-terminal domain-containing protein n=1 Tax=Collybiopsis confluens TaxID=2823264 RepID=A0A8H5H0W7_9AGAR|nr:hypothetical protein D9757_010170 [Collybiopsis confluens]